MPTYHQYHNSAVSDQSNHSPRYLDKHQVAELLAVSKRTIDAWVATGFIPHIKIRRTIRFIPEEIEAWVRGETVSIRKAKPAAVEVVEASI